MSGSKTIEAGLSEFFTIDGTDYPIAQGYQPDSPLEQATFETMSLPVIQAKYLGDGMVDRPDRYVFPLPYRIGDSNGSLADQIELLRATPGPHFLADWKQRIAYYTLRASQAFLYLPREDANARTWKTVIAAQITPSWAWTPTVVYKNSVVSGDSVPSGELWISKATIQHPESGRWVAPFKMGTPPVAAATLIIRFFPVFRVEVLDVKTDFTNLREDKMMVLAEVN
jgi:hypothetical protein